MFLRIEVAPNEMGKVLELKYKLLQKDTNGLHLILTDTKWVEVQYD